MNKFLSVCVRASASDDTDRKTPEFSDNPSMATNIKPSKMELDDTQVCVSRVASGKKCVRMRLVLARAVAHADKNRHLQLPNSADRVGGQNKSRDHGSSIQFGAARARNFFSSSLFFSKLCARRDFGRVNFCQASTIHICERRNYPN